MLAFVILFITFVAAFGAGALCVLSDMILKSHGFSVYFHQSILLCLWQ